MSQNGLVTERSFPQGFTGGQSTEKYFHFLKQACDDPLTRYAAITFPLRCPDPFEWLTEQAKEYAFTFYWENSSASHVIAALGAAMELSASGSNRFAAMQRSIHKATRSIACFDLPSGASNGNPYFVGGLSFFDEVNTSSWDNFPPALFTLPELALIKKEDHTAASISLTIDDHSTPEGLHQQFTQKLKAFPFGDHSNSNQSYFKGGDYQLTQPSIPEKNGQYEQWVQSVQQAKEQITDEELDKVVLARRLQLHLHDGHNIFTALNHLRRRFPACCSFLIQRDPSAAFMGCSPEQLLLVEQSRMQTEALAGTIGRGNTPHQDEHLKETLIDSLKDQKEHAYVVQGIRELLEPFIKNIHHPDQPFIKKLTNVQHLCTPISGMMKDATKPLVLLEQLHPTPSVGGTPRKQALDYIRQHEPIDRGWFAGPVGWLTANGEAEFTVAIRSGLIEDNTAQLFAGCGIVADSDPEAEWQETNLKFAPMLSALNYD